MARHLDGILAGDISDPDAASRMLSYDVHGWHIGLVVWKPADCAATMDLGAIAQRLRRWGPRQATLMMPDDETSVFAWIRLPRPDHDLSALGAAILSDDPNLRVACGDPGQGLAGFRETHRQAKAAHGVGELAEGTPHGVLHFRDVAAISFLVTRPEETSAWVRSVLGGLGEEGEETARLRETVRVFLGVGENTSEAAARLFVHRNTVKYRVARARELLASDLDGNRLNVALALDYCHWLSDCVNPRPGPD